MFDTERVLIQALTARAHQRLDWARQREAGGIAVEWILVIIAVAGIVTAVAAIILTKVRDKANSISL